MGTTRWKRMEREEEQRRCESEGGWADIWMMMSGKKKKDDETTKYGGDVGERNRERERWAGRQEDMGGIKEGCRVQCVHQCRELRWEISL